MTANPRFRFNTIRLLGCISLMTLACVSEASALDRLHLLIPGAAGGGWDRTARGTGEALTHAVLVRQITYENLSGGGGSRAIAHLLENQPRDTLMVNSTPIVVRALRKVFPQSFRDLAPVASIIGDYSVIAVRRTSPYTDIAELGVAQREHPRAVPIAGGSVPGGTDHIVAAMVVHGLGGDVKQLKYIPYDAGGKAMAGLLSGEVAALSSGYGEVVDLVEQGWVRILCVTAEARLAFIPEIPTCLESGADGAVFVNWRGFFAPPNTPEPQLQRYRMTLAALMETEAWEQVRQRYGWINLYRAGEDFTRLLENQEATLKDLLTTLNLL